MKMKLLLLATVAAIVLLPSLTMAQEKGATMLKPIRVVEDLQQVEAGDSIVMSCPKCKDTYVSVVIKAPKGSQPDELRTQLKHLCPTCETSIKTEGTGKNAKNTLVHTCKSCGSTEVTCCLMKKNGSATTGMDTDKK